MRLPQLLLWRDSSPDMLVKQAVGANARRIAKLLQLRLAGGAIPATPFAGSSLPLPKTISRAMAQAPTSTPQAQLQDMLFGLKEQIPRGYFSRPGALPTTPAGLQLAAKENRWADQELLQRLVSGRHGSNRQLFTDQDLLGRLPAGGSAVAYRGFPGYTPFRGFRTEPGSALFTTGDKEVAVLYGVPDLARGVIQPALGNYVSRLSTPALEQAGASGPWSPHLALDTRKASNAALARLFSTPLRHLVPLFRGSAAAAHPQFERVFTTPPSLAPATQEAFKFVGQPVGSRRLFMRVAGQPAAQQNSQALS